jgi:hypothetical protein
MIKKANMNWTVKTMSNKIQKGEITFDMAIQRGSVWDNERRSLLIHSVIMDYPIPPFFVLRDENGNYSGLDGRQRGETFKMFLNNEFALSDNIPEITLENGFTDDISGMYFEQLDEETQDKIKDYNLTLYWFDSCITDDEITEMFFRLNNGKPLTAIELTRVKAKSMDTIKEIATHPIFDEAISEKAKVKYTNELIVINSYALLYADIKSLETKATRQLMESVEITAEQSEQLDNVFTKISDTYLYISKLAEAEEDKDKIKQLKKVLKRLYTKTHLTSIVPITAEAIQDNLSISAYAEWLIRFYSGTKQASINQYYNNAAGSGSAKPEAVKARLEALETDYNSYFNLTATETA